MANCERCGSLRNINIHHKNGNHSNDVPENRQALCRRCHSQAHVQLLIHTTGHPGTRPLSEYVTGFPKLEWAEVRRQYFTGFPRAYT